jgi:chromosome segregation ATPase
VGFVSYMEDIQQAKDSLRIEIRDVKADLERGVTQQRQAVERAKALVRAAERLVETIDTNVGYYLSLATDPSVELVDMIEGLRSTKRQLEAEVAQRSSVVRELRAEQSRLDEQINTLKVERDAARKEARQASRDFELLAAANQAAAYDMYSSPEQIRRLKPNA